MGYDAFISYSHAADGQLAPAVQSGLQRMARPWYRRRALHVFRDETGLAVNPDLWQSIRAALDESEWFVLFASPEAAQSQWVDLEVETWLDSKPVERVLPVVTGGVVEWDPERNDFSADSDAIPPSLRGRYRDQPHWLDLRWARTADDLDLRNAGFRLAIAGLAAPMHGMPTDEFEGEDVRMHRRGMRLARLAIVALLVFACAAIASTVLAFGYAQRANASADRERHAAAAARAARADAATEADNARDAQGQATKEAANAQTQQSRAESEAENARQAQSSAEEARLQAEAEAENARRSQGVADANAQEAEQQAARADRQASEARTQGVRADAEAQRANDAATTARRNADEASANAAAASANAQSAAENAAEAKRIADDLATANTSLTETNDQLVTERDLSGRQRVAAVANRLFAESGSAAGNHDSALSSLLAVQGQRFAARTAADGGGGRSVVGRATETPGQPLVGDDDVTAALVTALTDNPALREVPSAPGLQGVPGGMGYSADGTRFAAATTNASFEDTVTVWELPSWTQVWTSGPLDRDVRDVAFVGDDMLVLTTLSITRFDRTGSGYQAGAIDGYGCCLDHLEVAGDTVVATANNPHGQTDVVVYDTQLRKRWQLFGQFAMPSGVSDDGTLVAIEHQDGAIPADGYIPVDGVAVYDATTGVSLRLLSLPTDSDGTQLSAVHFEGDEVVALEFDATSMRSLRWAGDGSVTAGPRLPTEVAVQAMSADGRYVVVTNSFGPEAWLYDMQLARAVPLTLPRGERFSRIAIGPDEFMVRGDGGTTLRFGLDVETAGLPREDLARVDVPTLVFPQIEVGPRYTALYAFNVRLFDNSDGHELPALPVMAGRAGVDFDSTGAIVAVAGDVGVQLFDAATSESRASAPAVACSDVHFGGTETSGTVFALCQVFDPQANQWVTQAHVWDVRDGAFVTLQTWPILGFPDISMDDNGQRFVIDRYVYGRAGDFGWQVTNELPTSVTTMSPDGSRAAFVGLTVDMYDVASGQLLWRAAVSGNGGRVTWSADGSQLFVSASQFDGSDDQVADTPPRLTVWDVASGALSWTAATDRDVSVLPGDALVDASIRSDGDNYVFELRRFSIDADALADRACEVARRDLTPTEWTRLVGDNDPYEATCSSR